MPPPPPPADMTADLYETEVSDTDIGTINNLDNEHTTTNNTMYSRNNAMVDSPIQEDLNAQKTVMGIVNYFCTIRDHCLKFTTRADGEGGILAANVEGGEASDENVSGNPWAEEGGYLMTGRSHGWKVVEYIFVAMDSQLSPC